MINTTFNGYDDTIKAQAIQAFQMVLESIEQQACSITGVFQEKLGGIQQRDAVSNVKVGIRQSTLLTKQYFSAMDLIYKEVNYDLLNLAKIVFKNVNQFLNVYPNIKYIYIDEYDIKQKMCYPVMIEIEDSTFQLMNSTIRHNTEINLIINNLNHEIVEFIKLFLINNEFRQM